jgi:DNA mismatch repair protein MutS
MAAATGGIVQEYLDLTKKWQAEYGDKTILLYMVGSFYEVYALEQPDGTYVGSHIAEFALINDMVIARKNSIGNTVVMAGVGVAYAEKYITKLQEHNYTVVIYKQDINGKNTTRSLAEIVSPGTHFGQESSNEILSNHIMSIWLHKCNRRHEVTCGVANIDIFTGKVSLYQFTVLHQQRGYDYTTYDDLERYVSIFQPNECIIISNMERAEVTAIKGFVGLNYVKTHEVDLRHGTSEITKYALNAEKQTYQQSTFQKFYPKVAYEQIHAEHYLANQTLCFLLDFVYQHNPNLVNKLALPVYENYSDKLILANHSLGQLNIISHENAGKKLGSISSLLNNCVTTMGKRHFLYHLQNPTTQVTILEKSYAQTEYMLQKTESARGTWSYCRTQLGKVKDLEKFTRKIVLKKVTSSDFLGLLQDLETVQETYQQTSADTFLSESLNTTKNKKNIGQLCEMIMENINQVLEPSSEGGYIIKPGVNARIDELMGQTVDGGEKLEAIRLFLSTIVQRTETGKDNGAAAFIKIHETAKNSATLVGTSRRVAILKKHLQDMRMETTTLSYTSNFTKRLQTFSFQLADLEYMTLGSNKKDLLITNAQIRSLVTDNHTSKEALQQEILLEFNKYVTAFGEQFDTALSDIAQYVTALDLMQCKCYTAHKYNYCKPVLRMTNKTAFVDFQGLRHPLIEHLQTKELYVTNDLKLGTDTNDDANDNMKGILLYGTNAVGKTSFIKSVGIAVIMAQAGLYVPCQSFVYKPYTYIFTRILGNDNIFKGLSTFAVEMSELRTILNLADENSLVLGDELCAGTESDSALSIFATGLETLHHKNCTFLFATHFHEIVQYEEIAALSRLKFMHMTVQYDQGKNVLVYDRKLKAGPGDSMYGLEVCKALHLPSEFLQRAHDLRMKYNKKQQNVLAASGSHYNAKKLQGNCELCHSRVASEVHHLQHQRSAQESNGYIKTFHKNHQANLLNICESCHHALHKSAKQHRVAFSTEGYILQEI